MKQRSYALIAWLTVAFLGSAIVHAADKDTTKTAPAPAGNADKGVPAADPAEQARMDWFGKARYGMFIHWGLYSELGGYWQGKPVPHGGEWIMHFGKIPSDQYEKTAAQFNPVKFDADAWVKLAKDAGMKYIVITAKHHEGFAMFDSKASPFNIVDDTPFKRDVVKEMSAACAKYGIRFGVYYSQALDWHEPNGMGDTWSGWPSEADRDFDKFLTDKVTPQLHELLTHYGPISLVWFDMPSHMTTERAERLFKQVRSLQPDCLINSRVGGDSTDPTHYWDYLEQRDGRYPIDTVMTQPWETAACINHTWGYKKDDTDFKTPASLNFELVDITSHGGNFLLNVGPDGLGVIPPPEANCLLAIGKWLRTNGESVYGAGPTPFGGEFGAHSPTQKDSHGGFRYFISKDWRCTTQPDRLYIHLFTWPGASFTLPAYKGKVVGAYMLADPKHKPLTCTLVNGQYHITLPASAPDPVDSVLCLETAKS